LGEQAVVVHKYLLELGTTVEGAVDLSHGSKERLLGNIRLRIRRDASVCKILAQSEYHSDLGARSLINAVDSIKNLLVQAYLDVDEEIRETPKKSTCFVDVSDGEIVVKIVGSKS
jgi:ATP-dependent Clp protease ATP-binding subunit ClpA